MGGAFTGYSLYAFLNTTKKLTVKGLPWNTITAAAASILPNMTFFFISKSYGPFFYKQFVFNTLFASQTDLKRF